MTGMTGLRRPRGNGGRDWNNAAKSQGMSRISRSHLKLEEVRKDSSLETSEGAWLC